MHAAQKRGMYPQQFPQNMNQVPLVQGGHPQQTQNVPGGQVYPHNQQNFVPIPMHQGYGRPGMNAYGRGPMPQHPQRQIGPQFNANAASGQPGQFYPGPAGHNAAVNTAGYQNVQGYG